MLKLAVIKHMRKMLNNFVWLVLYVLVFLAAAPNSHANPQQFATSWDARWHLHQTDGLCELAIPVPQLGHAQFVASSNQSILFELQFYRDVFARGEVSVYAVPPGWSQLSHDEYHLGNLMHLQGGGLVGLNQLGRQMFWALRDGLRLVLRAPNQLYPNQPVEIYLDALGLNGAAAKFLGCAETVTQIGWSDISRSRVTFASDQHSLTAAAKSVLDAIAMYAKNDKSIAQIFIDGHTDSSGEKRHNKKLSKRRADAVARYLKLKGLSAKQFTVRFHGERYPVADNKSDSGKAQNRRTTLRLQRG